MPSLVGSEMCIRDRIIVVRVVYGRLDDLAVKRGDLFHERSAFRQSSLVIGGIRLQIGAGLFQFGHDLAANLHHFRIMQGVGAAFFHVFHQEAVRKLVDDGTALDLSLIHI